MATLQNPFYTSPIADAVANLGKVYLSGPSEAERIAKAETALKLKTQRENLAKVSEVFGAYGTPGFDRNTGMASAVLAGYDPSNLAGMERYGAANTFGAMDPRTTNAFVGAGGAYSSTGQGFRESEANTNARAANVLAENARQFNEKPYEAIVEGKPVIMTNKTAVGNAPVLSETDAKGTLLTNNWSNLDTLTPPQQRVVGAAGTANPTPRNYVAGGKNFVTYDGKTDVNGAPLPAGGYIASAQGSADDVGLTNSNLTKVQANNMALERVESTLSMIDGLSGDPTNFGPAGIVKGAAQNTAQAVDGIAKGLGFNGVEAAVAGAREKLIKSGVNPSIVSGLFDPTLPKLNQAYSLLLYQGAEALAGQSGRSVTDADIKRMVGIIGDPESFWSSQATMKSRTEQLRQFIAAQRDINNRALNPGAPPAAPAGAGAPPQPGAVKEFIRGPDGKLILKAQ